MTQEGLIDGGSCLVENRQRSDLQVRYGTHTTVAAVDTVVTGLAVVLAIIVSPDSDPIDAASSVTATAGDQAGTPAAGSVLINSWMMTSDADVTLKVATTFSKKVGWVAFGYGP